MTLKDLDEVVGLLRGDRNMKKFLILLLCFGLVGCASTQKIMDSWTGHHQSELIASWGPPTRTASDGKGGAILIYESYVNLGQTPGEAQVNYSGKVTYTSPQQRGYTRTRMFYVDARGYIYHWRAQGL